MNKQLLILLIVLIPLVVFLLKKRKEKYKLTIFDNLNSYVELVSYYKYPNMINDDAVNRFAIWYNKDVFNSIMLRYDEDHQYLYGNVKLKITPIQLKNLLKIDDIKDNIWYDYSSFNLHIRSVDIISLKYKLFWILHILNEEVMKDHHPDSLLIVMNKYNKKNIKKINKLNKDIKDKNEYKTIQQCEL